MECGLCSDVDLGAFIVMDVHKKLDFTMRMK